MKKDALLFFLLIVVNLGLFFLMNLNTINVKFAYEYGNIAIALLEGRGFSDPFTGDSGPTAWMPPLYVWILALIFKVAGVKTVTAMWLHFFLQSIAYALIILTLIRIVRIASLIKHPLIVIPLFYFLLLFNRQVFFIELHDIWLVMLLSVLPVYAFLRLHFRGNNNALFMLIIAAAAIPLTSPGLALAFLMLCIVYLIFDPVKFFAVESADIVLNANRKSRSKMIGSALLVFVICIGSWTYRNYIVFDKIIPLKSNLWYDLYQANELDEDGIVSAATFMKYHPVQNQDVRRSYREKGEIYFIVGFEEYAKRSLKQDPLKFIRKVLNRFVNVFIYTKNSNDLLMIEPDELDTNTIDYLTKHELLSDLFWIEPQMKSEEFRLRTAELNTVQAEAAYRSWLKAKQKLKTHDRSAVARLRSVIMSLFPFLAIIICLFFRKARMIPVFWLTIAVYLIQLSPYIVVSHYMRYQFPLIALQILLFVMLAGVLQSKFAGQSERDSNSRISV